MKYCSNFSLLWLKNVALLALYVCFTPYVLFIAASAILDEWQDYLIQLLK